MYTLVNTVDNHMVVRFNRNSELIDKVRRIVIENEDYDFSILGVSDAFEYIQEYSQNLALLNDKEVDVFLKKYGKEVGKSEPLDYVELMMDDHKCIEWNGKLFYLSDSLSVSFDEDYIYKTLYHYFRYK